MHVRTFRQEEAHNLRCHPGTDWEEPGMHEFAIRRRCATTHLAHPITATGGARPLSKPHRPPAGTGLPLQSPPHVPT